MDKRTSKLLLKRVKSLSKWTEGVFVNPVSWEVNGKQYYMAGFTLRKRVIATAYLTLSGDEVREEALEAQRWLSLYSDISNNLLAAGKARMRVPHVFFQKPLEVEVPLSQQEAKEGREAFAKLWDIQQQYEKLAQEYITYYHSDALTRGLLEERDIRYTQKQANRANLLQYRTLKLLIEQQHSLQAFVDYLKTLPVYTKWRRNEREFLAGLLQNTSNLSKNLDDLGLIVHDNLGKMEQLNLAHNRKLNDRQVLEQRTNIRYPL
ncbi:hypothetical protein [Planomicrobium sp. YIM 101495]|uniref:hypothetical protein n=1 Tax=Planomicrobium sp. YIM 101495 TaxID=2665160 RepID=UPI0012B8FC6C|nr:hypothetical protein [Planomicrobium sp. YIM 101495]MTD30608.1 hypothetical protein [Planomicrobium sp. YIM 101495]